FDCLFLIFFFQAEDGIRVFHVTGVQTCALPISLRRIMSGAFSSIRRFRRLLRLITRRYRSFRSEVAKRPPSSGTSGRRSGGSTRSEERRVGKECRSRRREYHKIKKQKSNVC